LEDLKRFTYYNLGILIRKIGSGGLLVLTYWGNLRALVNWNWFFGKIRVKKTDFKGSKNTRKKISSLFG